MVSQEKDCCDALASVVNLQALLQETFRISEKILSRKPEDLENLDEWNSEIMEENLDYLSSLSSLHKKFLKQDGIIFSKLN